MTNVPNAPEKHGDKGRSSGKHKRRRTRRRKRSIVRMLLSRLAMLGVLALAMAALVFVMLQWANAPGPLPQRKVVLIERGTTSSEIAATLEKEQVVLSRHLMLAVLYWQRLRGDRRPLKAGEYAFQPGVSLAGVLEQLRQGKSVTYRLTIPEGFSVAQVLERVRAHPALSGELTIRPEEGSLLPDTYVFSRGETRNDLVRRMMRAMQRLLEREWPKRQPGLPLNSPKEAVILASIVEKETAVAAERARVAAVYINRLRKGMPLQADPTVIYGITKGLPLGRPLKYSDLRKDTPWNTYTRKGLPPTPIANPGRDSILAVLHPAQTDELYFVADGSGGHVFATNLKDHQRNVANWRKWKKEQAKRAATAEAEAEATVNTTNATQAP